MNATIRSVLPLLAMFGVSASAQECQWSLQFADVTNAMGKGVMAQPVFARGVVEGFRIYGTRNSAQLTEQEIKPGAKMTRVCGVPAREIYEKQGLICCNADASREFEVTFRIDEQDRKMLIKRP